ncbi:MAG: hypothetical protein U0575_06975 [Phycisphaerales bacterium]
MRAIWAMTMVQGAMVAVAMAADVASVFDGSNGQSWTTAANWTPSGIPNNNASNKYYVTIDGPPEAPFTVQLNGFTASVNALTVGPQDTLQIGSTFTGTLILFTSAFVNDGVIALLYPSGVSSFGINATVPYVLFAGNGEIHLNAPGHRLQKQGSAPGGAPNPIIELPPSHVLRGSGEVQNLTVINHGLVDADLAVGALMVPSSAPGVNTGTMRARSGGTLNVSNFDNTQGLIVAEAGGIVYPSGIAGGVVRADPGGTVYLLMTGPASALTNVTFGGTITALDDGFLGGTIVNPDEIVLAPSGSGEDPGRLRLVGVTTFVGPGVIKMTTADNLIAGYFDDAVFKIAAEQALRGGGTVSVILENEGLIEATSSVPLNLSLKATGNVLGGVIRAKGGTLRLLNGSCACATGVFEATEGGIIAIDPMTAGLVKLFNPTFEVEGGSLALNTQCQLHDAVVHGNATIPVSKIIDVFGTLEHDGSIDVGLQSRLRVPGDTVAAAITGAGTVRLHSGVAAISTSTVEKGQSAGQTGSLDHAATHTIAGAGRIELNSSALFNHGTIVADDPLVTLRLTWIGDVIPSSNDGLLRATNGATLRIQKGLFDNTNGAILADDASLVRLGDVTIAGGTLVAEGSGKFQLEGGPATIDSATVNGLVEVTSLRELRLRGAIELGGEIRLTPGPGNATLRCDGAVTVNGGTITLGPAAGANVLGLAANSSLAISPTTLLHGRGEIASLNLSIDNNGAIQFEGGPSTVALAAIGGLVNDGVLDIAPDASVTNSGALVNRGTMRIRRDGAAIGSMTRTGSLVQEAGVMEIDGLLKLAGMGNMLSLTGGRLRGTGEVTGAVVADGATVELPGAGHALTIGGSIALGDRSIVQATIDSNGAGGQLLVSEAAILGGTLLLSIAPDSPPSVVELVKVDGRAPTSMVAGAFQSIEFDGPCRPVTIEYTRDSVLLAVGDPSPSGDLDCDGVISGADVAILLGAWGGRGGLSDLDGDGDVDGADLGLLLASWTRGR